MEEIRRTGRSLKLLPRRKSLVNYDAIVLNGFSTLHVVNGIVHPLKRGDTYMVEESFMRDYEIENEMYRRAVELIEKRYPVGWGGAGVVRTSKGNYYTSVSIETANASAVVCIELGAMLEAHKYNEKVTHCMCLIRDDESSPYRVLSPCGICQERLRYWGEEVQVAVTTGEEKIRFVELKELQPYHWTKAYPADELEHWEE